MKRIVLASTSPRRQEILALSGLEFTVARVNYTENHSLSSNPRELVQLLAKGKAESCRSQHPDSLILAADQVVTIDGEILGKPHTPARHKEMLKMLQGKQHEIVTGYVLLDTTTSEEIVDTVITRVTFRSLSQREIDGYVKTGEGIDRAGGYAIQDRGSVLVESIEGDYLNIVGLPLSRIVEDLKRFDVEVF